MKYRLCLHENGSIGNRAKILSLRFTWDPSEPSEMELLVLQMGRPTVGRITSLIEE